ASLGRMFVAKRRGRERGIWIMSLGGIGVPAGTPAEIIARLNREINAGLANFADEAALARLLIGAAAIAPATRRQWVKRIGSQLDPAGVHLAPALPGRHGRCLGSTLRSPFWACSRGRRAQLLLDGDPAVGADDDRGRRAAVEHVVALSICRGR